MHRIKLVFANRKKNYTQQRQNELKKKIAKWEKCESEIISNSDWQKMIWKNEWMKTHTEKTNQEKITNDQYEPQKLIFDVFVLLQ